MLDDTPTSTILTVILLTLVLLSLGGAFYLNETGHHLPGQEERTIIEAPLDDRPDDGTIKNYENDLTTEERNIFRTADGTDTGTEDTINADYVELDGQYYPVTTQSVYPQPVHNTFTITGVVSFAMVLAFSGALAIVAIGAIVYLLYNYSLHVIGPTAQSIIIALLGLTLIIAIILNPILMSHVYVSTTPVENPDVNNSTVVHLTDLDENEHHAVREAITLSTPTTHENLTYNSVIRLNLASQPLQTADYIHTDGEYYHLTEQSQPNWLTTLTSIGAALAASVFLTKINFTLYDDPDQKSDTTD